MKDRGLKLDRWILLEGNRYAVTAALLSMTFAAVMGIGTLWTFEMQVLLTETQAVQTVLTTYLSGIILLVSIVVSINSIVLSHDITAISAQEERIEGITKFRREIGRLADTDETPTDPASFLQVMARIFRTRANALSDAGKAADAASVDEITEYIDSIIDVSERLERSLRQARGGEFRTLWVGLETDYGTMVNSLRDFMSTYEDQLSDDEQSQLNDLMHLFELFAVGQEYFKTLYYSREITELSRTLLLISLPSIITTTWAILAVNAGLFPTVWVFGLPPLLTFVAFTFTVALSPFIVLTAYMLRVATVTRRTAATGPFVLQP